MHILLILSTLRSRFKDVLNFVNVFVTFRDACDLYIIYIKISLRDVLVNVFVTFRDACDLYIIYIKISL